MDQRSLLERVMQGGGLHETEAEALMRLILDGLVEPAWLSAFLVALRMKGESTEEITGFARAMRAHATPIPSRRADLVDTCGTGGDERGTFNISTTAAFVVAGAGARVAKHGNRSVSSRCGSADVLEALGGRLDLDPAGVGRCIDEVGFGFLFAPTLHLAMRHAIPVRKALGIRTVFNILGPLTNPAGAQHQVLGVYDQQLLARLAPVVQRLGNGRSLLVRGRDGLDELSVCASNDAVLVDDEIRPLEIEPVALGLGPHAPEELAGGDARRNADILRAVISGREGAARDVVLLNAGAALWACGIASGLESGIESAAQSIDRGRALETLDGWIEMSLRLSPRGSA